MIVSPDKPESESSKIEEAGGSAPSKESAGWLNTRTLKPSCARRNDSPDRSRRGGRRTDFEILDGAQLDPVSAYEAVALILEGQSPPYEGRVRTRMGEALWFESPADLVDAGVDYFGPVARKKRRHLRGFTKKDVADTTNVVWLDIDPSPTPTEDDGSLMAETKRKLEELKTLGLAPSAFIFSGRGCWAYWKLDLPGASPLPGPSLPERGRARAVACSENEGMAEIQTGDHFVDGDGHLWRVLRVGPGAVVLKGRGATIEFPLVDGVIVSDREFCPATLPGGHCLHGFPDGRGCPECGATASRGEPLSFVPWICDQNVDTAR